MKNPPQPERFEQVPEADPVPGATGPGSDLEHDEAADALETEQQARERKPTRDDQADEEIISLDSPD